jgi:hypothetical protein
MKVLLVITAMLCGSNLFAAEKKMVVIAERDTSLGLEQIGFVLKDGKIEATSNSNFLTNTIPFHFGAYKATKTPELADKILGLDNEYIPSEKDVFLSIHDLTIYVNGKRVPANNDNFGKALALIKTIFESKDLKLVDGVTILKEDEIKKIICEEKTEKVCVFKYGYLHN